MVSRLLQVKGARKAPPVRIPGPTAAVHGTTLNSRGSNDHRRETCMITVLIIFAVASVLPLLLATAVAVLARDPRRRADARRVVVLLGCDQGKPKSRH
jgi:hypothetical protein